MAPMLSSLTIEHFRTFRERVTIPLKPITVFIGPNNSGKTNAIRALQSCAQALVNGTGDGTAFLEVCGAFGQSIVEASIGPSATGTPQGTARLSIRGPALSWAASYPPYEFTSPGNEHITAASPADFLKQTFLRGGPDARLTVEYFDKLRVASFAAPVLRAPSALMVAPELGERGENFSAVLDWISGRQPGLFRAINEELRRVLGVDGCTTQVTQQGRKVAAIIEGDQSFPADVISDGVLLYLGLTTVAHLVGKQSLLIIEEPENGIHPRRLKALLEQIRRIATAGTQVILTTHSPLILDEFSDEPESVVVFERDEKGTHVKQLAEKEMRDVLSGDFGLGDLWYSGAIGGVPT